ncbi:MAG: DUF853 family protein [Clostridia bacterium]|nr:DUF853 family protein [Clostridia bacterium]
MLKDGKIYVAVSGEKELYLLPRMANRHGIITGATGTGKTVTLKVLAESFSDLGVPVFLSDVKGDLTGTCVPGKETEDMKERIARFGISDIFRFSSYPTRFWDIFGEKGHPVRVTISGMGPVLLSRMLGLTDAQSGVLNVVFRVADENGLLLYDLKDLNAIVRYVGDNRTEFSAEYGNIAPASVNGILRTILQFENEGGDALFGLPELDIKDLMTTDDAGRGYINVLESEKLINSPGVYSIFLLWLMTELFEKLPEAGDPEKPVIVFFFDEAHLLFEEAPGTLIQKIKQVVRLIRSKGVGVYFVTQSPSDIPDSVLSQLSNKIQHALRAYTPKEQKALRAAAMSFRINPEFDTAKAISELGVGEAVVSFLDEKGVPVMAEKAKILPPQSMMGACDDHFVTEAINGSELESKYREPEDPESAYEIIEAARETLAAEKKKEEKKYSSGLTKVTGRAGKAAVSSVSRSISSSIVNSLTGGKAVSPSTALKRAATSALNTIMRGFFGNIK